MSDLQTERFVQSVVNVVPQMGPTSLQYRA